MVENPAISHDWLVLFLSPTCPHCLNFKSTFYKSAFEHRAKNVTFGELNCTLEQDLCRRLRIRSYPQIVLIKGDKKMHVLKGSRSSDSLAYFIEEGWK